MRSLLLLLTALLATARPVKAQTDWLVTEVRADDSSNDSGKTTLRVAEILRARGEHVVDPKAAASELEHKHSRMPVRLQPEELEQLDKALRTLADHLASESLNEARAALEEVERLTPDARDYLNREVNRARRRFHTCLLAAHLFAKEGYDDDAFEQVRKCARDFPGFEPEEGAYMPDSIKSFFRRAREELESIRPATLIVRAETGSTERCRARVNGIDQGEVPARVTDVRADSVRVQLECDGRSGRIYNLPVQPGTIELVIDPRLDRALDTNATLRLHYPNATIAGELRERHSLQIARVIGVGHVLEVFDGRLTRRDLATGATTEADLSKTSLEAAVDSVRAAPAQEPAVAPMAAVTADPVEPSDRSSLYPPLAWISVGAVAVAGTVMFGGWRLYRDAAPRYESEACLKMGDPRTRGEQCPNLYDRASTGRTVMYIGGISAGVFAGLATLFFVLDAEGGAESAASAQRLPCTAGVGDAGVSCRVSF